MIRKILILSLIFTFLSCDKGLSPELAEKNSGFGGTITFVGDWDKEVTHTHIVLFKDQLLSNLDFNARNLKYVSDSITNGITTYDYSTYESSLLKDVKAGSYAYLAVAQSKTKVLSLNRKDWEIVGLYYNKNDSSKPGILTIPKATFIDSINIVCDFNNPPPQPPGKDSLTNIFNSNMLKNGK